MPEGRAETEIFSVFALMFMSVFVQPQKWFVMFLIVTCLLD